MLRLITVIHEIIANALVLKPTAPRLTGRSNQPGTAKNDNINFFYRIRKRNGLGKSHGLALVIFEDFYPFHNHLHARIYFTHIHLIKVPVYVKSIYARFRQVEPSKTRNGGHGRNRGRHAGRDLTIPTGVYIVSPR